MVSNDSQVDDVTTGEENDATENNGGQFDFGYDKPRAKRRRNHRKFRRLHVQGCLARQQALRADKRDGVPAWDRPDYRKVSDRLRDSVAPKPKHTHTDRKQKQEKPTTRSTLTAVAQ